MRGYPVDRGWAWVVLAGTIIAGCITSTGYVVGLFNIVFLDVFQKDKFTTSWIGSLASSLVMLTGPIATYLCERIGARYTVILGAVISASGFILTSFAKTLAHVFITYGVVTGVGIGLTSLPCVMAVGNHFDKYRNLAFGIYSSSVGLGSIIFPPLVTVTIEGYGWRGSTLILGGCCLNFLVTAACLRPPEEMPEKKPYGDFLPSVQVEESEEKLRHDSGHHSLGDEDNLLTLDSSIGLAETRSPTGLNVKKAPFDLLAGRRGPTNCARLNKPIDVDRSLFGMDFLTQSSVAIGSLANFLSNHRSTKQQETAETHVELTSTDQLGSSGLLNIPRKHLSVNDINFLHKGPMPMCQPNLSQSHGTLPRYSKKQRTDCSLSNYVLRSPFVFRKKPKTYIETSDLELDVPSPGEEDMDFGWEGSLADSQLFVVVGEDDLGNPTVSGLIMPDVTTNEREYSLVNFGLLGLTTSQFLFCIGLSITYLHLPAFAISEGTSTIRTASLICVIGVCNVFVRFLVGAATTNKSVDDTVVYIVMSFLAGIILSLAAVLSTSFTGQLLFAGLFGFFANGFVTVAGPLSIRYVGLRLFGVAYSIQMVLSGVAFFIGPPMAGLVFDFTGSYAYSFYIAGISYILGALIMIPVFFWERRVAQAEM